MLPITFKEFLLAADERTYQYMDGLDSLDALPEIILNKLQLEYKRYLICGGMPEAVVQKKHSFLPYFSPINPI